MAIGLGHLVFDLRPDTLANLLRQGVGQWNIVKFFGH